MQAATHTPAVHASRWGAPGVREQTCQEAAAGQQPVAKPERQQPFNIYIVATPAAWVAGFSEAWTSHQFIIRPHRITHHQSNSFLPVPAVSLHLDDTGLIEDLS